MRKTAIVFAMLLVGTICFGCGENKTVASSSAVQSTITSSSAAQSSQAASSSTASSSASNEKKAGNLEEVKNPEVTVTEAKSSDSSKDYLKYEPANSADAVAHVIFSVKDPVNNFRIVKLSAKNVYDDGRIDFLYEEVYKADKLTPEKPLLAGVSFGETIPLIGYMYTDASGKDRLFPMGLSGQDGSILVWEYK